MSDVSPALRPPGSCADVLRQIIRSPKGFRTKIAKEPVGDITDPVEGW